GPAAEERPPGPAKPGLVAVAAATVPLLAATAGPISLPVPVASAAFTAVAAHAPRRPSLPAALVPTAAHPSPAPRVHAIPAPGAARALAEAAAISAGPHHEASAAVAAAPKAAAGEPATGEAPARETPAREAVLAAPLAASGRPEHFVDGQEAVAVAV